MREVADTEDLAATGLAEWYVGLYQSKAEDLAGCCASTWRPSHRSNAQRLGRELTVTKTAVTSFSRNHKWGVDKSVTPDELWLLWQRHR